MKQTKEHIEKRIKRGKEHWRWKGGKPRCLNCGKQLSRYDNKRCQSCNTRGELNPMWGKSGKKSPVWKGGRKRKICLGCGLKIDYRAKTNRCQRCRFLGELNPNWQGGKSFEPYSVNWTETLKRAIRERDRYLCQICNSYGNVVHHIDENKQNCNPNNLITICNSCHTKLHRLLQ